MQVHFGDQIKLESLKTQGQFLHVGSRNQGKAGYNVLSQWLVTININPAALRAFDLFLSSQFRGQFICNRIQLYLGVPLLSFNQTSNQSFKGK